MKKSEISIVLGLCIALIISCFTDINRQARNVRSRTLRLHIIADDDSRQAQEIKLLVRDALLSLCAELYCPAESFEDAVQITNDNISYIERAANRALAENGAGYGAVCSVENFYFDTCPYSSFTMPRGEYTALTVKLGRAGGKNWWCVAYPSLCAGGSAKYEDDASNTFIETDSLRIKFKAVEIWEKVKNTFSETEKYTRIS